MPPERPEGTTEPPATVVLDANIFVSALINPNGPPAQIIGFWLKGRFTAVVSLPLLKEISDVLSAPRIKTKYGLSQDEIAKFIQLIADHSQWVTPARKLKICRHTNDDLILETAAIGKAKYLISRDDDIKRDKKVLAKMKALGVTILSVQAFLNKLKDNNL